MRNLSGELEEIRADQVSDEQVKRYHEVQASLLILNQTVAELESNPYLIELLVAEAETEHQLREQVVREAIARSETYERTNEERQKFDGQVAERFLSEEIEARGINSITDRRARKEALEQLTRGMITGMRQSHGQEIYHQRGGPEQVDALTGLALLNLVGGHGTLSGTLGFLRMSEAGYSPTAWQNKVAEKQAEAQAIHRHLGTLNLLRAYGAGMPKFHERVLAHPRSPHGWQQFDSELWGLANVDPKLAFDTRQHGPLIPRNASAGEKKAIEKDFEHNRKQAEALEARLTEREEKRLASDIEELEGRLTGLKSLRESQRRATVSLAAEGFERGVVYDYDLDRIKDSFTTAKRNLDSAKIQLSGIERNITSYEEDLGEHGALSFREKGRLKRLIRDETDEKTVLELKIKKLSLEQTELGQKLARIESAKKVLAEKSEWEVERDIGDTNRELKERRQELQRLEKKS